MAKRKADKRVAKTKKSGAGEVCVDAMPSREQIYGLVRNEKNAVTRQAVVQQLAVDPDLAYAVERRIQAMIRDGQLQERGPNKRLTAVKSRCIKATVSFSKNATAYLDTTDRLSAEYSLHASSKQAMQLMQGDVVMVRAFVEKTLKKVPVIIIEIDKRAHQQVVGQLRLVAGHQRIETLGVICSGRIEVAVGKSVLKPGDFVTATIVQYPTVRVPMRVEVDEVLGDMEDPRLITRVMQSLYHLPDCFSDEAMREAEKIDAKGVQIDASRVDDRERKFFTIDGADARDFDDAICVEASEDGWRVSVAISDVSHYIKPGTALDKAAYQRATSVYLPNSVLPMLPSILSDGLCSLNPLVDRLVKCVTIQLSLQGEVKSYAFTKSVIRSQARLTYDGANEILEGRLGAEVWLESSLQEALQVYRVLAKKRARRGALEIELPYASLRFNKQNRLVGIIKERRLVTHKIIEEFMLLANETTAGYLLRKKEPAVYRNHDKPDIEKITKISHLLQLDGHLGAIKSAKDLTPKRVQAVIHELMKREQGEIYIPLVLSTLAQACYEETNKGHFGLSYRHYTHFTSPIRRYPDLIVHRSLDRLICGGNEDEQAILAKGVTLKAAALHTSIQERNADEAQKKSLLWLKAYFMQDKIGRCYEGVITGVRSFGLFVCIDEYCIDGLCHISTLDSYYRYDEEGMMLISDCGGVCYRMGQRVKIKVTRVDCLQQQIDVCMV